MTEDAHLRDVDLLLVIDADLEPSRMPAVRAHLARCTECQQRLRQLSSTDRFVTRHLPPEDWTAAMTRRRARVRLAGRLVSDPGGAPILPLTGGGLSRAFLAAAALAIFAAGSTTLLRTRPMAPRAVALDGAVEPGALPIRHLTPGATRSLPVSELCGSMPLEPSPIPAAVREKVLRDYGMQSTPEHEYELDYLVTPDLGGSPDPRNLWPEPYGPRVWNARVKDELESLLPRLVCEGKVDLVTAQRDIATDWIAAYKKYFATDRPIRLYSTNEFGAPRPENIRP